MHKTLILIILACFFSLTLKAQEISRIDSLQLLVKKNDISSLEKAKILNSLSLNYHQKELYPKAIHYKELESEVYFNLGIDSSIAYCNERLGVMYYHIGSYNISSSYLLKSLLYFEGVNNGPMIAQISTNLANVFTRLENHKKAITYLSKAEKIFKHSPTSNSRTLAGLYTNLGLAYSGNLQLDSAMLYYNKALSMIDENENPLYVASILNNIGEVDYELGNNNNALINYERSLNLFTKLDNLNGMGAAKSNIAKLKIRQGKYDEAILLCNESLEHFITINSLYFIVSTHEQLYYAYKGKGDYIKALEILELYQQFNDSLMGSKTTEHIANLEMQYQINKEQQKFKLLEQQKLLVEKENEIKESKLYITYSGLAVLLLIMLLVIISYRSFVQKNKHKQQILAQEQIQLRNKVAFKQKELENFAGYIKEKNQLLETLKNEVRKEGKKDMPKETLVKNFTALINSNLHIDNDRKKLELKIDSEHQEFVKRLSSKHSALTKNDIRLCSLILLDLSTKEIASVLNIEVSSVKMNKNRLRKKINLPPAENLLKYLNTI